MKDIINAAYPEWYRLYYFGDHFATRIHKSVSRNVAGNFDAAGRVLPDSLELDLHFEPMYKVRVGHRFGFDASLWFGKELNDWIWVFCEIPIIRESGRQPNNNTAIAVCASLQVLFSALNMARAHTEFPQILTCGIELGPGGTSASFELNLSGEAARWIRERENPSLSVVQQAMAAANKLMWNDSVGAVRGTEASVIRGKLHLLCGFTGSGMVPGEQGKLGYEMQPVKVCSPLQALTLLAGAARLYSLVHEVSSPLISMAVSADTGRHSAGAGAV